MRMLKKSLVYRLAALASLLTLPAACGPYHQGEAGGTLAANVYFHNESLDQAAVYAIGSGPEIRIGTVMAGRTDTLTVPANLVGGSANLRIFARPLGRSYAPSSGSITLLPGDAISITLPSDQRTLVVLPPRS